MVKEAITLLTVSLLRSAWRASLRGPLRFLIVSVAAALIAALCATAAVQIMTALDWVTISIEPQDGSIATFRGSGLNNSDACALLGVSGVLAVALEVPRVTVTAGEMTVTAKGKQFSEGYITAREKELVAGSLTLPPQGQVYCHLGLDVAKALFGSAATAVGQTVDIDGIGHEVRAVIGREISLAHQPELPEPGTVLSFVVHEGRVNDAVAFPLDPVRAHRGATLLVVAAPDRDAKSVGMGVQAFLVDRGHDEKTLMMSINPQQGRGLATIARLARVLTIQCLLAAVVTMLNMLGLCLYWSYDRRGEVAIHAALGCNPCQVRLSAACEVTAPAATGWLVGTGYAAVRYALLSGGVKVATMWGGSPPGPELVLGSAMWGAAAGAVSVGICVAVALGCHAAVVSPAELLRAAR